MPYLGWNSPKLKGMSDKLKAYIGRKKYGKKKFQKHAAKGENLKGEKPARGYKGKK